MSEPTVAALLLAGGASRRMGSPKALLDFHGRPLWQAQVEKLRALAPAELFISAPRELALPPGDWKVLHDDQPNLGPLAGLWAARQAMSTEWLIVLAIDLPEMTSAYLARLCAAAIAENVGQVPQLDGFHLGLSAVYSRVFLGRLHGYLESADRSVQRMVKEGIAAGLLAARPVLESERGLFLNANDPRAFAAALNGSHAS